MKSKIMDDIQDIQERVDAIGYKGSNEYDLELREQIAEYILLAKMGAWDEGKIAELQIKNRKLFNNQ